MPRFARTRKLFVDALSGPRVVFHHVPKCGGTSVAQALRIRYAISFAGFPTPPILNSIRTLNPGIGEQDRARLVDHFQERLFLFYLFHDIRCIAGHVRFSATAHDTFSKSYRFITTLRDPVSMMISHYFFQRKRPDDLFTNVFDLDAYFDTWEARELGSLYSYFFSGAPIAEDPSSAKSIALAKENLARFDAIGFVDDIPGFQRQLREAVGLRLRIGHANKSVASQSELTEIVTPAVRRRMEEMSAPNIEIYEFARRELAR